MNRRDFVALLGCSAAQWPAAAVAQPSAMPLVGYLYIGLPGPSAHLVAAFRQGLGETGYREGVNMAIAFRFAHNDPGRLPELAADLVRRRVAVIATPSSIPATLAARAATATIPIVFNTAANPVEAGLVGSLDRPGGNVTGVSSANPALAANRLNLLLGLVPQAATIAALINPGNRLLGAAAAADLRLAASAMGRRLEIFEAGNERDIDAVFASLAQRRIDALAVSADVLFSNRRDQLVALAARYGLPAIYSVRELPEAGGLMSYGPSLADQFRHAGIYTGRILAGEKPADLPVQQATKAELIINLTAAKALGLTVPPALLARADEVIG